MKYIELEKDEQGRILVAVCSECRSPEIGNVSAGDESWLVCQSCRSVEQGYTYIPEEEIE